MQGRLYLEYSNEVWDSRYAQAEYAARMASYNGMTGPDAAMQFATWRALEIFEIFDQVGIPAAGR